MEDFSALSIESLILRIQHRNVNNTNAASALGELYDLLGERVYSLALFILGDESTACQVTQNAFLHLWNHSNLYESAPQLLLAQLLQHTKQAAINHLKTAGFPTYDLTQIFDRMDQEPIQAASQNAMWQSLYFCMNQLSDEQHRMLTLSYYWGLSQHEIATKLGVTMSEVNLQMKQALDQLCLTWLETLLKKSKLR